MKYQKVYISIFIFLIVIHCTVAAVNNIIQITTGIENEDCTKFKAFFNYNNCCDDRYTRCENGRLKRMYDNFNNLIV